MVPSETRAVCRHGYGGPLVGRADTRGWKATWEWAVAALHQPERRGRVTEEHATNANPMMQHACGTEPGRPYVSKKRKGTAAVSDAFAAHQLRGPTPQAESLDTRSCRPSACLFKPRTQRGNPTLALRPCRLQSFSAIRPS